VSRGCRQGSLIIFLGLAARGEGRGARGEGRGAVGVCRTGGRGEEETSVAAVARASGAN
jgi:hypothetical protein